MSAVYIHIPFCAKKCYYCDFYTSLSIKYKDEYIDTIIKELKLRKNYLENKEVKTIYFGGGTPTILKAIELQQITEEIKKIYKVSEYAEITIEANPDDINNSYIKDLKKTEINRISIGIQSFFDDDLKLMNRRHNSIEALSAIKKLQDAGYLNLSGDLIYGLPKMNIDKWQKNLSKFFSFNIPHLSAYHITYEPNTIFSNYKKKGKIKELPEEESLLQFEMLINEAKKNKFIHYETSNFAKTGFFSKHNSSYWKQKYYLGLGASAHSYNGISRQYNVPNIKEYIKRVGEKTTFYEKEILTETDKYNEYLITSLRTMWGIDLNYVKENFGIKYYDYLLKQTQKLIEKKLLIKEKTILKISQKGKFIEDMILEELFFL